MVTTRPGSLDYHDDAEFFVISKAYPDSRTYRGHDGIRQWLADGRSVVERLRFEPRSFRDAGDTVLVEVAASGTGIGSGIPVEWTAYIAFSFRSGRIATTRAFLNEEKALEAVGLSE